jgi:hypothetical protein
MFVNDLLALKLAKKIRTIRTDATEREGGAGSLMKGELLTRV